jgi:hypothetical protein
MNDKAFITQRLVTTHELVSTDHSLVVALRRAQESARITRLPTQVCWSSGEPFLVFHPDGTVTIPEGAR